MSDFTEAISELAGYNERIPEEVIENFRNSNLTDIAYMNDFLEIIGKIAKTVTGSALYSRETNPFASFYREMIPYGMTVEELWVDIIKTTVPAWNDNGGYALGRKKPDISALYHKQNYEAQYKVTTSYAQMKSAFKNDSAFEQMVNRILSTLYVSGEYDLELQTRALIGKMIKEEVFANTYLANPTTEALGKLFMKELKSVINNFGWMNEKNNKAGVLTRTPDKSDIVIMGRNDVINSLDVDLLAGVYNLDKIEVANRLIPMPESGGFGEANGFLADGTALNYGDILALVLDSNIFRIYPTLMESSTQWNAAGLFTNNFLTMQWIFSYSHFHNAVALRDPAVYYLVGNPGAGVNHTLDFKTGSTKILTDYGGVGENPLSIESTDVDHPDVFYALWVADWVPGTGLVEKYKLGNYTTSTKNKIYNIGQHMVIRAINWVPT